jgi:membrane protein implicated in regulation of membrane protease activity
LFFKAYFHLKRKEEHMAEWLVWFALAAVVVILEMFTGTFYLLMIGIGLAAGGLAALAGTGSALQFIIAAIAGICATYLLRRSKLGKWHKSDTARDPNVNLDIGQTLTIEQWHNGTGDLSTARAMYRGAMWDVQLAQGAVARPGLFVIREIQGSRLIVSNNN